MDLDRYRPNVGVVLVGPEGKVWLGRRAGQAGPTNWQFPQGGVEEGETLLGAARRELREETGVTSTRLLGRTPGWLAYAFPPEHHRKKSENWLGQKQVWFALRFEGEEAEIDLGGHTEVEFDAWRWADLDEAVETVVEFKREVYRQMAAVFRPLVERAARASPTPADTL